MYNGTCFFKEYNAYKLLLQVIVRVSLEFHRPMADQGTTNFTYSMGRRTLKMDDNVRYV